MIYLILSKYGYIESQNKIEHVKDIYEKWKGKKETVNTINQMKKSIHDIYLINNNEDGIINFLYKKLDDILSENTPNVIIQNTEPTKLKIVTNTNVVSDESNDKGCCILM